VLEVLVYILVKVDEVRENAAGALKEIAGTGINGMYPVGEARVEPVCLPWRYADEVATGEIAVAVS